MKLKQEDPVLGSNVSPAIQYCKTYLQISRRILCQEQVMVGLFDKLQASATHRP